MNSWPWWVRNAVPELLRPVYYIGSSGGILLISRIILHWWQRCVNIKVFTCVVLLSSIGYHTDAMAAEWIHYTVREVRIRRQSLAIHPPSVQIHQSSWFPAGCCNISMWKVSSGQNLKTNFSKTRWCCKTVGGLLLFTCRSQDSEILSYGLPSRRLPKVTNEPKYRPGRTSFRSVTTTCDRKHYQ